MNRTVEAFSGAAPRGTQVWTRMRMARRQAGASLLQVLVTMSLVVVPCTTVALADDAPNYCKQSATAALSACHLGAQADNALSKGKCKNYSSGQARQECRAAAADERDSAFEDCHDQFVARTSVCTRLGKGAYDPEIVPGNFVATVDNPFFPLTPGKTYVYEANTADGLEHNEVAVTTNTRQILGVTTIEVHDTVRLNGELTEDTLDWYAQDVDGNVWYFGENSKTIENGLVVSLEGSWEAGIDGAKAGIIMEANPQVGDFYRQEFDLGTAEDLAEVVGLNESETVPYGSFTGLVKTKETSPLEPDAVEFKLYASGIGVILEISETGERSELISVTP